MFIVRKSTLVALVCALALLAGACGSSASSTTETQAPAAAATAPAASESAASDSVARAAEPTVEQPVSEPVSEPADDSPAESPLGELFGLSFNDGDAMQDYFANVSQQAEALTAECMRTQGFEYRPASQAQISVVDGEGAGDTREYAEQYGFGIASNPFEEAFEAFDPSQDPNLEYVESLSEGEQEAYYSALYGLAPESEGSSTTQVLGAGGGCSGEAFEEAFSFGQVFEQFGDQLAELEESMASDPRIVAASSDWSTCMSSAGYGFSDEQALRQHLTRRYDAIVQDPGAFASDEERLEQAERSEDEVVFIGPQTLNPAFQTQVDELAVEERAMASASWDCNVKLRAIAADVRIEYEQKFVEENGAAVRAALAG